VLQRLLAAIGIHRYRSSLQFVSSPTRVRLRGSIACENSHTSSASGLQAAWMRHVLGTVESYYDSEQGRTVERVTEVASHEPLADLIIATDDGLVRVPAGSFEVRAAGEALAARTPLSGNPPAELHDAISESRSGSLIYGEQYLRKDDAVALHAVVGPSGEVAVPWTAVSEERALVIDRSLEELGL
jgi:hypothetical protein